MGFKIAAVLLSFTGCLLPYMASKKQYLLASPLPTSMSWLAFCILQVLALVILSRIYILTVALLFILMVMMCSWCALVLAAGHLQNKPITLSAAAVTILTIIMVAG